MGWRLHAMAALVGGAFVACSHATGGSDGGGGPTDDAGGERGGSPDASDDAGDDAGAVDYAGTTPDAGACPAPGTTTSYKPYAWSCGSSAYLGNPSSYTTAFAGPTVVTLVENHMIKNSGASTSRLYAGCDLDAGPLLTEPFDGHNREIVVGPGLYTFLRCDSLGALVADPLPVPVNANTSCATASSSLTTAYRVYDATTRLYYAWSPDQSPGASFTVTISSPFMGLAGDLLGDGTFKGEVQATCDDPTTDVVQFGGSLQNIPRTVSSFPFSVTPKQGYVIVLSEMDPALQPTITITESFP